MPIRTMQGTGGIVFHVLNRGARKLRLFEHAGDYRAWLAAFREAQARVSVQIFAYCIMPNHFHLVLRPRADGELADFMRLGTGTHGKRWHHYRGTTGGGAVYQGRYRAFPIQTERYFLNACRYVEANPLRAGLVSRAEDWEWSSAHASRRNCHSLSISEWPIVPPSNWNDLVNEALPSAETDRLRRSARRNVPLGDDIWVARVAKDLGLDAPLRPQGRPKKTSGVVS